MSAKERLAALEKTLGARAQRDNCPMLAVGIERPGGLIELGGRLYTQAEIDECFGPGRGNFVILDDGPIVEV